MKNVFLLLMGVGVVYLGITGYQSTHLNLRAEANPTAEKKASFGYMVVYDSLKLEQLGLQQNVFEYALRGWQKIDTTKSILLIADMSQPSTNKRLYVVDLRAKKLLFNTYVAHGKNSGGLIPDKFSNTRSSWQTSLGFYKTLTTYMGKHGLSLQLKGLEKDINNNVYDRNIVLHGADYVNEEYIRKNGQLGCSEGCPAVPYADSKKIIPLVKGGSCLFIYAPNADYLSKSTYLTTPYAPL